MYDLILTQDERKAIDWVGHRYNNGNELYDILMECKFDKSLNWDCESDIKFHIPEHLAFEIRQNAIEDYPCDDNQDEKMSFPCFAPDLELKMFQFCDNLI